MTVVVRIDSPPAAAVDQSRAVADGGIDGAAARVGGTPTDGGVGSLATGAAIRYEVFVDEQGVEAAIEFDAYDTAAEHVLVVEAGRPIGTARVRPTDGGLKCERVAVRASARGAGWGRRLMELCETIARQRGLDACVLHAQQRVEGFYRRLGYEVDGEPFEEAGIPHVKMQLELTD